MSEEEMKDQQLIELLIKLLIEGKSSSTPAVEGHTKTLFGDDGSGGIIGSIHKLDKNIGKLEAKFSSLQKWVWLGVTINVFMFGILVTHLSDTPKSANADTHIESTLNYDLEARHEIP